MSSGKGAASRKSRAQGLAHQRQRPAVESLAAKPLAGAAVQIVPSQGVAQVGLCTRIWWVRPVSRRRRSSVWPSWEAKTCQWVTAGWPSSRQQRRILLAGLQADGGFHRAVAGKLPLADGVIRLFHLGGGHGGPVLAHQEDAAGVLIQAVQGAECRGLAGPLVVEGHPVEKDCPYRGPAGVAPAWREACPRPGSPGPRRGWRGGPPPPGRSPPPPAA